MLTKDCKKEVKMLYLHISEEDGAICLESRKYDTVSGTILKAECSGSQCGIILEDKDLNEIYRIGYSRKGRDLGNEFMNALQALADRAEEITPETRVIISITPEDGLKIATNFEDDIKPSKNLKDEITALYKDSDNLGWIKAHFLLEDVVNTINRRVVAV